MTTRSLSDTPRTYIKSKGPRELLAREDPQDLYDVLDAGFFGHLGIVHNGDPLVVPTAYARDGDHIYMHGSTGATTLLTAGGGATVCFTVSHLDGILYGRAVFNNSLNYRSAVVYGVAQPITDTEERLQALRHFTERLAPGSWDMARRPSAKELAQTAMLKLPLDEASVKVSDRLPRVAQQDLDSAEAWSGVLPVQTLEFGEPFTDPKLGPTAPPVPEFVASRKFPQSPPRNFRANVEVIAGDAE